MLTKISDVTAIDYFNISFTEHDQATGGVIHANSANSVAVKISVKLYGGEDHKTPVKLSHEEFRRCISLYSNDKALSWKEDNHENPLHYTDEKNKYCRPVRYIPTQYSNELSASSVTDDAGEYYDSDELNSIVFYIYAARDAKDHSIYPRLSNLSKLSFPEGYVETSGKMQSYPKSICQINTVPEIDYSNSQKWSFPSSLDGLSWVQGPIIGVDWSGSWSSGHENANSSHIRIELVSRIAENDHSYELVEFAVDAHNVYWPGNYGCCNAMIFRQGSSFDTYAWHVEPSSWESGQPLQGRIGFCKDYRLVVNKTLDNVDYDLRLNNATTYLNISDLKVKQKNSISIYVYRVSLHEGDVNHPTDLINKVRIKVTDTRGNTGWVNVVIDGSNKISIQ